MVGTEQQCRATDECLQLFGGYGYTAESTRLPGCTPMPASRKIYGGANEVMKDLIAGHCEHRHLGTRQAPSGMRVVESEGSIIDPGPLAAMMQPTWNS